MDGIKQNLKSVARPADYDGSAPNVVPVAKPVNDTAQTSPFTGLKLKKVERPADYDGQVANVGVKKQEEPASPTYDTAKLKKVQSP